MSTVTDLESLQARRPGIVEAVNRTDAVLGKAHAVVRQHGIDFTRCNREIGEKDAKLQQALKAD
jgi:hypothetical protein